MGFNYGRVGGAQIPAGGWVTGLDGYYGEMLIHGKLQVIQYIC
jgi:hypothetical protein